MTAPVLVDTDPGVDDALALLLALRWTGWRVEAITTVAGNVPVDVGTRNVARVLAAARPDSPPRVAAGAAAPRARRLVTATHVHGPDGLGGLAAARDAAGRPCYPEAAVTLHPGGAAELILACARRWRGALVVVTLGPLTNLAAALDRDPEALRGVRRVVSMGGAVAVPGNVTAVAEFNVFVDPESAAAVLGAGLPLTLVPLDVTREAVWSAAAIGARPEGPDPVARFARALGRAGLARAGAVGEAGLTLHDPLAVGVALDPTLVRTVGLPLAVETEGRLTRGMTVADRRAPPAREPWPACEVALGVDAPRFLRLFEACVCGGSA